jgi:hypothetical protein
MSRRKTPHPADSVFEHMDVKLRQEQLAEDDFHYHHLRHDSTSVVTDNCDYCQEEARAYGYFAMVDEHERMLAAAAGEQGELFEQLDQEYPRGRTYDR